MITNKPDGLTPDNRRACTRDTNTQNKSRVHKSPYVRGARAPVRPSGAPIGAGLARQAACQATRQAVRSRARLSSFTHTHKKEVMEKEKKPMRQAMPQVAAWIDDLRLAFGKETIDAAIRAGLDGQQTFHAKENGHEIGTPIRHDENRAVSMLDIHLGPMNLASAPQTARKGTRRG